MDEIPSLIPTRLQFQSLTVESDGSLIIADLFHETAQRQIICSMLLGIIRERDQPFDTVERLVIALCLRIKFREVD